MNTYIKKYTNKHFSDALKELKEVRNLSYNQISIKSGLSAPYIFELAKGKLLPPKDENLQKIAEALGVLPEYFKEYRQRRLAEKLDTINLSKDDYDTPLSEEEVAYLKKIIDKHLDAG